MSELVFKLSRVPGAPVSDEELIADLRRVAELLGTETVTARQYQQYGEYGHITQHKRFGSWNEALCRARLKILNRIDIPDVDLFENILTLWQHYGRQPRRIELASSPSRISQSPYNLRFGSWMNALKSFVEYANGTGVELIESLTNIASENQIVETVDHEIETVVVKKHKTPRNPSLRLRWRVLQRDNFKCCGCGASPAITLGAELHVDHIDPWDNYGETVLENLQTLCSICNLGKSNLLPEVIDLLQR